MSGAALRMDAADVVAVGKFLRRITEASVSTGCTLEDNAFSVPGQGTLAFRWDGEQYIIDDWSGQ